MKNMSHESLVGTHICSNYYKYAPILIIHVLNVTGIG